jgi:phosphomevalonate kinase
MRLSVPGNLLLLGEYAVLEDGGLGLAAAVDRRVRCTVEAAPGLSVRGTWPGGAVQWTPSSPGDGPLVPAVVEIVEQWFVDSGAGRPALRAAMELDSAPFFLPGGRKSGLGSSAAVTVALTCALLAAGGRADAVRDGTAFRLAVQAHRRAQGGAGSGYDVACSFHGGLGLFHGGAEPRWEPCRLSWTPSLLLFSGPAPVSTAPAVRRYSEWKARCPAEARAFLEASNRAVAAFVRAGSEAEACARLAECRDLGISLGRSIGVSAEVPVPEGLEARWCKAAGAGNELGVCLRAAAGGPPADRGVTWEE